MDDLIQLAALGVALSAADSYPPEQVQPALRRGMGLLTRWCVDFEKNSRSSPSVCAYALRAVRELCKSDPSYKNACDVFEALLAIQQGDEDALLRALDDLPDSEKRLVGRKAAAALNRRPLDILPQMRRALFRAGMIESIGCRTVYLLPKASARQEIDLIVETLCGMSRYEVGCLAADFLDGRIPYAVYGYAGLGDALQQSLQARSVQGRGDIRYCLRAMFPNQGIPPCAPQDLLDVVLNLPPDLPPQKRDAILSGIGVDAAQMLLGGVIQDHLKRRLIAPRDALELIEFAMPFITKYDRPTCRSALQVVAAASYDAEFKARVLRYEELHPSFMPLIELEKALKSDPRAVFNALPKHISLPMLPILALVLSEVAPGRMLDGLGDSWAGLTPTQRGLVLGLTLFNPDVARERQLQAIDSAFDGLSGGEADEVVHLVKLALEHRTGGRTRFVYAAIWQLSDAFNRAAADSGARSRLVLSKSITSIDKGDPMSIVRSGAAFMSGAKHGCESKLHSMDADEYSLLGQLLALYIPEPTRVQAKYYAEWSESMPRYGQAFFFDSLSPRWRLILAFMTNGNVLKGTPHATILQTLDALNQAERKLFVRFLSEKMRKKLGVLGVYQDDFAPLEREIALLNLDMDAEVVQPQELSPDDPLSARYYEAAEALRRGHLPIWASRIERAIKLPAFPCRLPNQRANAP